MDFKYRDILLSDAQLGPYPLEKLKRVDFSTNKGTGEISQRSQGDIAFARAHRGEYGEGIKKEQKFSIEGNQSFT